MARLGIVFQIGCFLGVLLLAAACASGTNKAQDAGYTTGGTSGSGTAGTAGVKTGGTGGAAGSKSTTDPTKTTGGSGGTPTAGTGGTTQPVCGNNKAEGTEVCDGTDLKGASCGSLSGYTKNGTLQCATGCQNYDPSMCYEIPPTTDAATQGDGASYANP